MHFIYLLVAFFLFPHISSAQKIVFKTSINYKPSDLEAFYASINLENNTLIFNAPDYTIYAYDTKLNAEKWKFSLGKKSNIPPFFVASQVWANTNNKAVKLDVATGKYLKELPFSKIETRPLENNGFVYLTGLYNGGSLISYDNYKDTIVWSKFIAHGVSKSPYYLQDKIVANVEGNNWLAIKYDGTLQDQACDKEKVDFPSELTCVKTFAFLTHDNQEIPVDKFNFETSEDLNSRGSEILYTKYNTFILENSSLIVIDDKGKMKSQSGKNLSNLLPNLDPEQDSPEKILKANGEIIWLLYSNHLIELNFKKNQILRLTDLSEWQPHQVILDQDKIWLISRKDGQLYGLKI